MMKLYSDSIQTLIIGKLSFTIAVVRCTGQDIMPLVTSCEEQICDRVGYKTRQRREL